MLLAFALFLPPAPAVSAAAAPEASAASVVLMEQESRTVLYSREAERQRPIASITKIMTGLLVAESCDLQAEVTIRQEWLGSEGSSMGLRPGETLTVEELLYGLLLVSGNDAATALACYTAGDVSAFVRQMNARAAELGMSGTSFRNPHGLTEEGHYSTARDMGILACAAMEVPSFARIVGSRTAAAGGKTIRNHNRLLWDYPGALGIKTGYTEAAGRTLVSCAEREGMTLVCVTLNDPADWKDHAALLDWGFETFVCERPAARTWRLPVIAGTAESVILRPESAACIPLPKEAARTWRTAMPSFVYAPCLRGTKLGSVTLLADGEPVYSCPLTAGETVPLDRAERLNFWEKLRWAWYCACRSGSLVR